MGQRPPGPPPRFPHSPRYCLDDTTRARIEALAIAEGISRSAALRLLVERGAAGPCGGTSVRRLA